jgi:hypothetical protein
VQQSLRKYVGGEPLSYVIQINAVLQTNSDQTSNVVHPNIQSVLQHFEDVFAAKTDLPPKRPEDHEIPLKDGCKPPNIRPYRVPHKQKDEVEQLIRSLLQDELIRPSISPYSSPAILVRKKDGSLRLCIDYRELNSQTVKNRFPIPVIEDLLDELYGAQVFSKIDLNSEYHHIRMKDSDVSKTAFRTYFGHFEFLVMPFDLTNAPATFQSLMNKIFSSYLRKFVLAFFGDILIYSQSIQDHVHHLSMVLEVLRGNKLTAKRSKCVFATSQVEYLGHIISSQGVATDPEKIVAIQNWKPPKSVTQLRSFLGLTRYYRRFIQGYGLICRPLHDLLKDSFHWGVEHTEVFNTLKSKMTQAQSLPCLIFPCHLQLKPVLLALALGLFSCNRANQLLFTVSPWDQKLLPNLFITKKHWLYCKL